MNLILTFLCSAAAHAVTPTLNLEQFQAKMRAHISKLDAQTTAGVFIQVLGSQRDLFNHAGDVSLIAASASKLITTTAALETLGRDATFESRALLKDGSLIVQGGGDPSFDDGRLKSFAQNIAESSHHILSIQINNSVFTSDYTGLEQFAGFDSETDAPAISATSLDDNVVFINVTPDPNQNTPAVDVGPHHNGYAIVQNKIQQNDGQGSDLHIKSLGMSGDQEVFELTGTIGRKSPTVASMAAARQPSALFAYALAGLLRDLGVQVDLDYSGVSFSPPPEDAVVIASSLSDPLVKIAQVYMTESDNFMAEMVFQMFGAAIWGGPASIVKSQVAVGKFLERESACRDAAMENGSGLTWNNKVSPRCFVQIFQNAKQDGSVYADLVDSLPIGGKTGTLKNRFKNPPPGFKPENVRGKTGTLSSRETVTALIGVTPLASGETAIFSFQENDSRGHDEKVMQQLKNWEDASVELLQQLAL